MNRNVVGFLTGLSIGAVAICVAAGEILIAVCLAVALGYIINTLWHTSD